MRKIKEIISSKYFKFIMMGIGLLLIIIFIISSILSGNKKRACNTLKENIITATDKYVKENNLLPTLNGDSVVINLNELTETFSFKKSNVTGTITYTNYNGEYIKTFEIQNADYCSTKEFGKEKDKYNEKNNVKVIAYFNYNKVDHFNSKWTNYLASDKISTEATNGVYLPIDKEDLPVIPTNAVITEYVTETKTYYSYRDKMWKWYINDVKYSNYSSTKPNGYTNKDASTQKISAPSEWSLNYPDEYEYRTIQTRTGYQWYYEQGKEKIYWENGKYSTESPGKEYKKDLDTAARMYSYTDKIWRWYNGNVTRIYSAPKSTKPANYNYKDQDTLTYTNWFGYTETSYLTNENKSYREQRTDIRTRYLIKYDIHYENMLDKPVSLEELENILGKSYEEILNDKSINVNVTFKFQTEA